MNKRVLAGLMTVAMASTLFGVCAQAEEKEEIVVAFSQMEMNNAWRVAETNSIQEEAEARGIKLIYTDANGDTAKQVSDVEEEINGLYTYDRKICKIIG